MTVVTILKSGCVPCWLSWRRDHFLLHFNLSSSNETCLPRGCPLAQPKRKLSRWPAWPARRSMPGCNHVACKLATGTNVSIKPGALLLYRLQSVFKEGSHFLKGVFALCWGTPSDPLPPRSISGPRFPPPPPPPPSPPRGCAVVQGGREVSWTMKRKIPARLQCCPSHFSPLPAFPFILLPRKSVLGNIGDV